MKKNFYLNMLGCGLAAMALVGCEKSDEVNPDFKTGANQYLMGENCYAIDFEEYTADNPEDLPFIDHVTTPFGKVWVKNTHRSESGVYSDVNVARIYDALNPTGDDAHDLGQAKSLGKMLVANHFTQQEIAENPDGTYNPSGNDLRIAGPNDNAWGATMELDFSDVEGGKVTMQSIDVVDIDLSPLENKSYVRLMIAGGGSVDFPLTPYEQEGSIQTLDLKGTKNVEKLIVILDGDGIVGSGAIDNITFCTEATVVAPPANGGCTRTQGYWKTHADSKKKKYDSTWDEYHNMKFYASGYTYYSILLEQPKGNAYFILAHQYVAATLNLAAGAGMSGEALDAYNEATELFKQYKPNQVTKSNKELREKFTSLGTTLDKYNNGIIGPGHCD